MDTTASLTRKPPLVSLTFFRFWAAFYVFAFHLHLRWPLTVPHLLSRPWKHFLNQGAVGMTFFFVLSGFILAYNYEGQNLIANFRGYFIKRVARIYPVYLFCLLLSVGWFHPGIPQPATISRHPWLAQALANLLLGIQDIFCLQAWFPQTFNYWNNAGSWSLSAEMFFYLLFPFLLFHLGALSTRALWRAAFIIYALCLLPGLSDYFFPPMPGPVYYATPIYRLPEFTLGVIAALLLARQPMSERTAKRGLIAAAGLLTVYLAASNAQGWLIHHWLVVPCFMLIVAAGASLHSGAFARLCAWRPFQILGESSYSFYLVQTVTIFLAIESHDSLANTFPILANPLVWWGCVGIATLIPAVLVWRAIEIPARTALLRRFSAAPKP